MKMMIYKLYNSCGRRMMSLRRKFLTRCTQNSHNKQISKQEHIMRPQCGRSERAECGTNTQTFLSDVYKMSTRARKRQVDATQYGRSMVEMLGVLAIIGVLSVGGIAGYSKAMNKYKLNQYSEAVNMLINNVLQIKGQLQHKSNTVTYFNPILYKLKLLPDGIIYKENSTYAYDKWFNNGILVTYNNSQNVESNGNLVQYDRGFIRLNFSPASRHGSAVCYTAINAIKENAGDIEYMQLLQYSDSDNTASYGKWIMPQELLNLSLSKIDELCNHCTEYEVCGLLVAFK